MTFPFFLARNQIPKKLPRIEPAKRAKRTPAAPRKEPTAIMSFTSPPPSASFLKRAFPKTATAYIVRRPEIIPKREAKGDKPPGRRERINPSAVRGRVMRSGSLPVSMSMKDRVTRQAMKGR